MKAAMDEAKAAAEREKLENRLRKLQRAGHDISQLEKTYEGMFWIDFALCITSSFSQLLIYRRIYHI